MLRAAALRLCCASAQYRSPAGWSREVRRDHAIISGWLQQDRSGAQQAAYDLALGHLSVNALVLQRGEKRGPLFEAVRQHWDTLLDRQTRAQEWRASWPSDSGLDEAVAPGLVLGALFGATWTGGAVARAYAGAGTAAPALRYRAVHG